MPKKTKRGDGGAGLHCACTACAGRAASCIQTCINCRREVEESLTRVAGRKLRKMRALPECSIDACAEFLRGVQEEAMRLHLASMAWWRFSSDCTPGAADKIREIMSECRGDPPDFCVEYMHRVIRVMSPLTQPQIAVWFGHENLFQIAELFSGIQTDIIGARCSKCRLYRMGCTAHGRLGADSCPLRDDKFVQSVAAAVAKAGEWNDPCRSVAEKEEK